MSQKKEKIRKLNDLFRKTGIGGKFLLTRGIQSLGNIAVQQVISIVADYNDFTSDNDPYGEHDFGSFSILGQKIIWKIDYYDKEHQFGSEDPANPKITERILTVMLGEEY